MKLYHNMNRIVNIMVGFFTQLEWKVAGQNLAFATMVQQNMIPGKYGIILPENIAAAQDVVTPVNASPIKHMALGSVYEV